MNKTILTFFLFALICTTTQAQNQQAVEKKLKSFTRIIASPHINLILRKGETESIRIATDNVSRSKINIEVTRKTLHIYLDGARKIEKQERHGNHRGTHGEYEGVSVTAYVTYKDLDGLEIMGQQELTCYDALEAPEFTLRAYGENEINLASLKTEYFRVAMYGANKLRILAGKVIEQRYKLYGENDINTLEMKSVYTSTSIFGEGDLRVNSAREVRINAFGEPNIQVNGGARVNKQLVIGRATIRRE